MANIGVKTGSNVFYIARSEASKHNQYLSSREGAADMMSIDRGRLFRIESGVAVPYPEEVMLMSELYGRPELENHYCTSCCALGYDRKRLKGNELDRITVEALSAFRKIDKVKDLLLDITEDGEITANEVNDFNEVLTKLDEVCAVAEELKLWAKKHLKEAGK